VSDAEPGSAHFDGRLVDHQLLINRRIPTLDGLRAVAVIAVIICHVNWAYGGPFEVGRVHGPIAAIFGWGWIGVDLFFVLSGFLITGILYDVKCSNGYFRNFYVRRALRIMPLYYGFLFFALTVLPRVPGWVPPTDNLTSLDILSLALYFYNFHVVWTERPLGEFHPLWSLAVEEHFYLLWPLVVWVCGRRQLMYVCLAGTAGAFLLRVLILRSDAWPLTAFFITPCRLDGLLAGSLVALAWRDPTDRARLQRHSGQLVLASGCLLLGIALSQRHFLPDADRSGVVLTLGLVALAVFFAAVLVLVLKAEPGSRLERCFRNQLLCTIGKYSYAIYLFHSFILSFTRMHFPSHMSVMGFLVKPLVVLWVLGTSLLAAWVSYQLFESHFLRLKRYFDYSELQQGNPMLLAHPPVEHNA